MKWTTEHWYAWILGIVCGCLAYLNGPPDFLQLNLQGDINFSRILEKAGDALWALFVAAMAGIGGLAGKWIWDKKIKPVFEKKKKRK
jgi:hypothetical protein